MGAERLAMAFSKALMAISAPARVPITDFDEWFAEMDARPSMTCSVCGEHDCVFDDDVLPPGFTRTADGTVLCEVCSHKDQPPRGD